LIMKLSPGYLFIVWYYFYLIP